jgi:serine/threonine-protein kinase HipA
VTSIHTHVELDGATVPVGQLYSTMRRGRLASTFSYDSQYVARPGSYSLEPGMPLGRGIVAVDRALPRALADSAPDRWGRNLIAKRARAERRAHGLPFRQLDDRDYLLGVSDLTRQGALRFTVDASDQFEHPSEDVPKLIALPELMRASEQVARDEPGNLSAIKTLLDAGTGSLGGARPKASVRDDDGLLIAKFAHPGDQWNVIAWEATVLELARKAGIAISTARLVHVEGHSVLLLRRFDREAELRVGYASALTMLEADDGESRDYFELAESIPEFSAGTTADLRELWRRIAFSIAIHNTDDHLRNHGFLRGRSGWSLSPAFDINPNPDLSQRRVTTIGGASTIGDEIAALVSNAAAFELTREQARSTLASISTATAEWQATARRNGIPESELTDFAPAFDAGMKAVSDAAA